jgi:hypothetical protein
MNNEIKDDTQDYVMIFEAPKIEPPEFRLYYDEETGKALFYTCEKPEGKFIVVDNVTFACARQDVRVIDGKLSRANPSAIINKLMPDDETGIECIKDDVSIVASEQVKDKTQKWKLNVYELG